MTHARRQGLAGNAGNVGKCERESMTQKEGAEERESERERVLFVCSAQFNSTPIKPR